MATQEEINQFVEQIMPYFKDAPPPDSRPEFSYPVVGQAMSDEMWQWVTKGVGNGVLDQNEYAYWLQDIRNSDSTAVLTKGWGESANAIVEGFYHQLSEDKRLEFPMPLTGSVTYHVCLTYDPRNHKDPSGPVSVQVYAGTPPASSGRVHVILWTVRRQANQLLSDAEVKRQRPRVAPALYVWDEDQKPSPDQVLFGSLCFVGETGGVYRAGGAGDRDDPESGAAPRWIPIRSLSIRGDSDNYEWPGTGGRFRSTRVGPMVVLEGRVQRTGDRTFNVGGAPYHIRTLPPEHCPPEERRFITKSNGWTGNRAVINIAETGEVYVYPESTQNWVSVDGIVYTAKEES